MQHRRRPTNWQMLRTWRGALLLIVATVAFASLLISIAERAGLASEHIDDTIAAANWALSALWLGVVGLGTGWKYPIGARFLRSILLAICLVALGWAGIALFHGAHPPVIQSNLRYYFLPAQACSCKPCSGKALAIRRLPARLPLNDNQHTKFRMAGTTFAFEMEK